MSTIKSFATGLGDTYYIQHGSPNFTIIDCRIPDSRPDIVDELVAEAAGNEIIRFISTHPDDDHIRGLARLDDELGFLNFYCVDNEATKPDYTVDFERYCELRDSSKAFHLYRDCSRCWMNRGDAERGPSGINILWPDTGNDDFQNVRRSAADGGSPNNLSTIIKYSLEGGVTALWLGDLETDFMETIEDEVELPKADIVFAAHHGRARMPASWMAQMDPAIVVLGEAPREHLEYYPNRDHLRQNTAWDMTFECESGAIHIYVGNPDYKAEYLEDHGLADSEHGHYIGTLRCG